ncbi:MAG TPA: AAA family ATPase, partial [Microlunatus sp.]
MLEVRVLGDLHAELDGEGLELPRGVRSRALLGWLAIHPGRHSRSKLAALFWPNVPDPSARASLRSAIWTLRSALGSVAGSHLVADRDSVTLAGPDLRIDLRAFTDLVSSGCAADAVALCRGPLLNGLDDDWVIAAREEHNSALAETLSTLTRAAVRAGDAAGAAVWARRRETLQPLDESAAADLIAALADTGDIAAALSVYQRLGRRLETELGVLPSDELTRTARELRAAVSVGADAVTDVAITADGETRLVGRAPELTRLIGSWRRAAAGSGRVAVLTGEGGIGKTRLLRNLSEAVHAQGGLTVLGVSDRIAAQPFAPWAELIVDLIGQVGRPPDRLAAELGWVVPAALLRHIGPRRPAGNPQLDRVRFFEAVVELVAWAGRDRPLLLIMEDLHLADSSSVQLAGYLGRRLGRLPALLMLSWRRLPPRSDLDTLVGGLRSRGACDQELNLGPLPAASIRELARGIAALTERELDE